MELLRSYGYYQASSGWIIVEGQVKNRGNVTLRDVYVYAAWYSKDERIIDKMWELPDHVFEPGESTLFSVGIPFHNAPCGPAVDYRINFRGDQGFLPLGDRRSSAVSGRLDEFTLIGKGCEVVP